MSITPLRVHVCLLKADGTTSRTPAVSPRNGRRVLGHYPELLRSTEGIEAVFLPLGLEVREKATGRRLAWLETVDEVDAELEAGRWLRALDQHLAKVRADIDRWDLDPDHPERTPR